MLDLKTLYQEIILDHNKNPRNYGELESADFSVEGYNPLCGDHYTIYVKFDGDVIADISFKGSGCVISKASASVMTSIVKGKTNGQASELFNIFHNMVKGDKKNDLDFEQVGQMAVFSNISEFPTRVKCAVLPWYALKNALERKKEVVSTE